jgi:hypothetical protein
MGYFWNFQKTTQRKHKPSRHKFAQSGHPAERPSVAQPTYSYASTPFFKNRAQKPVDHELPLQRCTNLKYSIYLAVYRSDLWPNQLLRKVESTESLRIAQKS